jgi:hypothetical protein
MNTELNKDDERFVAGAKQLLDNSVKELDATIRRRLQYARLQALDARPVRSWWTVWAGGLAVAAVGALSLSLWLTQPVHERPHSPALDDFELITSAENVDLAEDLEFYHWLADADTTG